MNNAVAVVIPIMRMIPTSMMRTTTTMLLIMTKPVDHQFGLFGYVKPTGKVPMKASDLQEVKALIAKKEGDAAARKLRDIRESLERFERSLSNPKPHK